MDKGKKEMSEAGGEVQFHAADIGKKEKPTYFVRHKKELLPKESLHKAKDTISVGWQKGKFIILGSVLLILAVAATLVLVNILKQPGDTTPPVASPTTWAEVEDQVAAQAYTLLNSDTPDFYAQINQLYDEQIAKFPDDESAFEIQMDRCRFLIYNGAPTIALDYLKYIDPSTLTDQQLLTFYGLIRITYEKTGDINQANYYSGLLEQQLGKIGEEEPIGEER